VADNNRFELMVGGAMAKKDANVPFFCCKKKKLKDFNQKDAQDHLD